MNLNSAPQFNDTLGTVEGFDEGLNRFKVRTDSDGKQKAIREANLMLKADYEAKEQSET